MVLPTHYLPGNHPVIVQHPIETRKVTTIELEVRPVVSTPKTLPCQDLRKVGLESVGQRLKANRGDLGKVFEARAKADIFYCPVCPEPHPIG